MHSKVERAVAVVGLGAILPDAPDVASFWRNLRQGRSSIRSTPQERWLLADYYDADPQAPDKSYSSIGGWVDGFRFDWKRYRVPPRVAEAMDQGQQWAVAAAGQALADYGYPERPLDLERTGVILGTALGWTLVFLSAPREAVVSASLRPTGTQGKRRSRVSSSCSAP